MSEISGKIKVISDAETFGTFTKRSWVITTDEQYKQDIQLECHQDKCELLDKFKVGDDVKASLNIRGKEWVNPEGKSVYFNTLVSWRIEAIKSEGSKPSTPKPAEFTPDIVDLEEPEDDLPFG